VNRARFLEEAEAEFLKEVQFYAGVQVKGAARFRMAVEEAAARALAFPMVGPMGAAMFATISLKAGFVAISILLLALAALVGFAVREPAADK
jgi:hypothetical protein